jgi:hypothetical protein
MDEPGCHEYVQANIVQADYLEQIASISQLLMHSHQKLKGFTIHIGHSLTVQDNIRPLLADTFLKGGFQFVAILVS